MYIKLKSKQNYVVEGYEGDKSKKKKNMIVTEVRMIIISSSWEAMTRNGPMKGAGVLALFYFFKRL